MGVSLGLRVPVPEKDRVGTRVHVSVAVQERVSAGERVWVGVAVRLQDHDPNAVALGLRLLGLAVGVCVGDRVAGDAVADMDRERVRDGSVREKVRVGALVWVGVRVEVGERVLSVRLREAVGVAV